MVESGASFCGDCGRFLRTPTPQQETVGPPRSNGLTSLPQPQPIPPPEQSSKNWFTKLPFLKQLSLVVSAVGLICVLVGYKHQNWQVFSWSISTGDPAVGADPIVTNVNLLGLGWFTLGGYWFCAVVFCIVRSFHREMSKALKPIPSLQEIEQQLRAEGYDPSLQDVIAVEQQLKSERNEAALTAGAIYLGTKLAARQASGKKPPL